MKQVSTLLILAALAASCGNASKSDKGNPDTIPLFQIVNNPEHPKHIALRLVNRMDGDTSITYVAKGLYREDTVGFHIELDKQIAAGINTDGAVNEDSGFTTGSITFMRAGPESDRFTAALAELWHVDDVTRMKTTPVEPLVFSSNHIALDHDKSFTYSFKLFFAQDAPVPGEVFFTFDTFKKTIEFQEKDMQYRSQIVHSLGE
ncbi:hypothetical protein [Parapedobacter sp. 10938]|uniref:hypothetical protein n=1 Tax=Parapedobacter flavus TaxID=3110225 RepID=UPI002DBA5C23|nr:hypothetical protein [Parapedobacter sp. 10938]MEC3880553.1 hypothetical protein [Parapedobacter sp. 10938]